MWIICTTSVRPSWWWTRSRCSSSIKPRRCAWKTGCDARFPSGGRWATSRHPQSGPTTPGGLQTLSRMKTFTPAYWNQNVVYTEILDSDWSTAANSGQLFMNNDRWSGCYRQLLPLLISRPGFLFFIHLFIFKSLRVSKLQPEIWIC